MNAIRENRLQAAYEKALAEESQASERVRALAEKREALAEKLGLLRGLSVGAAA